MKEIFSHMDGFSFQIRENGSKNHPFYLCIYVDGYLVDQKSFKSVKAAEKEKEAFVQKLLVRMTRIARTFSKAHDDMTKSKVAYPTKTVGSHGPVCVCDECM